ncbi:MAG: hypothetical protein SEPTF4163_001284 [Sporothrix epigloea]
MASPLLRLLLRPVTSLGSRFAAAPTTSSLAIYIRPRVPIESAFRPFSSTSAPQATLNQVLRGCRKPQRARHAVSPALSEKKAPMMKGVCLKVGITRPKKPNSGERKTARIRLSNGRMITAYIPGEGHNIQQHSVVLVRGGRAQDCPGVRYRLIRGALDLAGVSNRMTSRSKFGAKKPKTASVG